jgi:assimilatory nitrate reductase catalytic subunit
VPEPTIEMNEQDMARLKLADGDLVHVTSRRGSLVLPVQASAQIQPAQSFIAMHWGEEFISGSSSKGERVAGVNALTTPAYCPRSKQPELKHAAVKILKAEMPWKLLAMGWLPEDHAQRSREQLRELMAAFPFASCVPFGRDRTGLLFRAAAYEAPPQELLEKLEGVLGLSEKNVLHYVDKRRGQRRSMRLETSQGNALLEGFLLAGDTSAEAWIRTVLQDSLPAQSYGRQLLVPGSKPPVAVAPRGKQVCTCFNVSLTQIENELPKCSGSPEARLQQLKDTLKCGTNCGSCVPEIQKIIRSTNTPALAA